jgi:hypothetical protein
MSQTLRARVSAGETRRDSGVVTAEVTHRLPARGLLAFDVTRGATVSCVAGELWVTGPGMDDRVLVPGESATASARGRVVVQALVDSLVRFSSGLQSWFSGAVAVR